MIITHTKRVLVVVALAAVMAATLAGAAGAATPAPAWQVRAVANPTTFAAADSAGASDKYTLLVTNVGGALSDATPITVTGVLPNGMTPGYTSDPNADWSCNASGQTVSCTDTATPVASLELATELDFGVNVDPSVAPDTTLTTTFTVSGGGAPDASTTVSTLVNPDRPPAFGVQDLASNLADLGGAPDTQAADHPNSLTTNFDITSILNTQEGVSSFFNNAYPVEDLRDIILDLPVGFVGNPQAAPRCAISALIKLNGASAEPTSNCPAASQVGTVAFDSFGLYFQSPRGNVRLQGLPITIFNMVPERGYPAEFGFQYAGYPVLMYASSVGNGASTHLRVSVPGLPASGVLGVGGAQVTFFGNPARQAGGATSSTGFFTNPSACDGQPLTTTIHVDSYQTPARHLAGGTPDFSDPAWKSASTSTPAVGGCNLLRFTPSISVVPDATVADSPTGLHVDLTVPQNNDPTGLATPDLKSAVVTLPAGVSVSPSAADGLAACSPEQIGLEDNDPADCPDAAKIGTVQITSPLLADPLTGSVFLAAQNDNPSHSVLGLYVVAQGSGVVVKLAGHVHADPATGQLTTTFDDNPQLPFSDFKLDFFAGPRAALATPDGCGAYKTSSSLTAWSGSPAVDLTGSFGITSGCGGGFAPGFTAGVPNPSAAASSTFTLQVDRADGQQHIKSVTTTLAPGILASVGSVPLCSDADASAGSCSAASQVGTTDVSAGPGAHPFHVAGRVFLTGPYKGGPYGLSIVTRAIAGPFDLGTVVVRAAINVDPIDAHVTVTSDDVPNILDVKGADGETDGFPLRVRSIDVDMNRPKFMVSPTSCDPMAITGTLGSWEGTSASVSSRFQVGDCQALNVAPKLALSLTGKGQTTDDKHPGVHAVLTQAPGLANLKKVEVTLPLSLALDPDNAQALCEFTDGSKIEPTCPKASIVGHVTAESPILNGPLTGPVYFVKNVRVDAKTGRQIKTLPKLVVPLTGPNGLRLNLTGLSSVPDNKHLVSTFDLIPDAPVSKFTLDIDGGKHGILVVSGTNICKSTQQATQEATGQNGKVTDSTVTIGTPCTLGITASSHTSTALKLTVGGLGAGKVAVSGKAITKTSRTIASATSATLTAKLTRAARAALAHHRNVTVKLTISFTPKGAKKAKIMHKTLTIHGASKAARK
jgi:hypothetical protein